MIKETFVRSTRRKLGWSQVRLGRELDMSRRQIQNYESRYSDLPVYVRYALLWLLSITIEEDDPE